MQSWLLHVKTHELLKEKTETSTDDTHLFRTKDKMTTTKIIGNVLVYFFFNNERKTWFRHTFM